MSYRDQATNEEAIALEALASTGTEEADGAASPGKREASPGGSSEEAGTLGRLYRETVGLLPYALDPVAPRPELKAELMRRIGAGRGEAAPGGAAEEERPAAAAAAGPAAPVLLHHGRRETAREPDTGVPAGPGASRRLQRWALAMAAVLALLVVGLSTATAWLFFELGEQRQAMAALDSELREGPRELVEALRQLSVVTVEEIQVCPMRPVGSPPPQPQAEGMLFMVMEEGRWHLRVRDLDPLPPGQHYRLWFMNEGEPMGGVRLETDGSGSMSGRMMMGADAMMGREMGEMAGGMDRPGGSAMPMTAVVLTRESGEVDRPRGQRILYGNPMEMDRL